jgi:formylglycine-generating enzyme required for sulfatase activity
MLRSVSVRRATLAVVLGLAAVWCAVVSAAAEIENPYMNAKAGDWAKYRYSHQGLPGGGYQSTRTVLSNDGNVVRIKKTVTMDDGKKTDSEETVNLREPFTLKQLLRYEPDAEVLIVARDRAAERLRVGDRELSTTRNAYDVNPSGLHSARRELWQAEGVPLDGVLKVRTVTSYFTSVTEMVDFGSATQPSPAAATPAASGSRESKYVKNSLGQTLVLVPRGEFLMGAVSFHQFAAEAMELSREKKMELLGRKPPQHAEVIASDFWMSAQEATVGQFRKFVEATGHKTDAESSGRGGTGLLPEGRWGRDPEFTWKNCGFPLTDDHPVVNVSWNDAKAFCEWLSAKEGKRYRLPTEAEWEYACRAGTKTLYSTGDDAASLAGVANLADRSLLAQEPTMRWSLNHDDGHPYLAPVGSFKPNAYGLYDMHGNALEWCGDRFNLTDPLKPHLGPMGAPVPPPEGPRLYVLRGGNWFNDPSLASTASRTGAPDDHCMSLIGFRIVLEARDVPSSSVSSQ